MMPPWDHTGVPGVVAFAHFHSSTTSASAALISARILPRVLARQSLSSAIHFEICSDADGPSVAGDFFTFSTFMMLHRSGLDA